MKFGKHIQSQQVPGWSAYYLDYKFLKKIISSLAANRPASEAALLALGIRPGNLSIDPTNENTSEGRSRSPSRPPLDPAFGRDEDQGPDFQAHKAAFFFKLERELEKVHVP
jgi:CDK inhibitor PHO81